MGLKTIRVTSSTRGCEPLSAKGAPFSWFRTLLPGELLPKHTEPSGARSPEKERRSAKADSVRLGNPESGNPGSQPFESRNLRAALSQRAHTANFRKQPCVLRLLQQFFHSHRGLLRLVLRHEMFRAVDALDRVIWAGKIETIFILRTAVL